MCLHKVIVVLKQYWKESLLLCSKRIVIYNIKSGFANNILNGKGVFVNLIVLILKHHAKENEDGKSMAIF